MCVCVCVCVCVCERVCECTVFSPKRVFRNLFICDLPFVCFWSALNVKSFGIRITNFSKHLSQIYEILQALLPHLKK